MLELKHNPKVIGLIRVSTKEQADDDRGGIPRQREVIKRIVEREHLNIINTIEISDVSGKDVQLCPEIASVLQQVQSHSIDGIVVADFDRFLRPDTFSKMGLMDIFQNGAILYYEGGKLDMSSEGAFMNAMVQLMLSGQERLTFKKRVFGGKEAKRVAGKHPNSDITLPFGVSYDRKAEKFIYTPEVTKMVEAFRLIDEDGVFNLVELERRIGIHHRTLANLLRNPIYMGERVYSTKRGSEFYEQINGRQSDRKKVNRNPSEIIRIHAFDKPAVSKERFERVQHVLSTKKKGWQAKRSSNPVINLGTGVARCGFCNAPLYCSSGKRLNRKRIGYYMCKCNYYTNKVKTGGCTMRNVRKDRLDNTLDAFVATQLVQPETLTSIIEHNLNSLKESSASVISPDSIASTIADIDRRLSRAYFAFEDGAIDMEAYKDRKAELEDKKAQAIAQKKSLESMSNKSDINQTIRQIVKGAMAYSRIGALQAKQTIIQQLFEQISFKNDSIISFKLMPQFASGVPYNGNRMDTGSWPPPA